MRDGIGQLWHLAAGEQTFGPGLLLKTTDVQQPQQLPAPLAFLPGSSPLRLGGRPVPRAAPRVRGQRLSARGQLRRARGVPLRRRAVGDAEHLASGGAEGTGRRGTLLRARGSQDRFLVRPLSRHSEPGLPRHRPREALDDGSGAGDRRARSSSTEAVSRRRTSSRARAGARQRRTRSGMARPFRTSSRSTTPTTRSLLITAGGRSPSLPAVSAGCSGRRGD